MNRLSVIVPVYKAEEFLPECLSSIEAQSVFSDIQLVLVDDGSPDSSGKICDSFAASHPNTVVLHNKNGGVSAARNAGLDAANGEFVGFIDSDDTVAPDYYENLLSAAEKNGCDMAYGGITFVRAEGRRECGWQIEKGTVTPKAEIGKFFIFRMLSDGLQNSACVKIMRRDVIESNKIRFPVGVKIGEDKRFVLEFLCHCESVVCAGGCGYYYRDVESSAMHSSSKMEQLLAENETEVEIFKSFGLDEKTVREVKGDFFFTELVDFFGREYIRSKRAAAEVIKEKYANAELMKAVDAGLDYVGTHSGRIYRLFAKAIAKRSVRKTLFALSVQKKINNRGA